MCVIGATLTLVNPTAATAIPNMIPETDRRLSLCLTLGRLASQFVFAGGNYLLVGLLMLPSHDRGEGSFHDSRTLLPVRTSHLNPSTNNTWSQQ
jgi:hypothetical protein